MKKLLGIFLVFSVLLFSLYYLAACNGKQRTNGNLENEDYLRIIFSKEKQVFLTPVNDLDFSTSGSYYTIYYKENIRVYNIFDEYYTDEIETENIFEHSTYLLSDELKVQFSDFSGSKKIAIQGEYTHEVEVLFDSKKRPVTYTAYNEDGEAFFSYEIQYLSPFVFYGYYYFRRLQEPIFYVYYGIKDLFKSGTIEGVIGLFIGFGSLVLLIWQLSKIFLWGSRKTFLKEPKSSVVVLFCGVLVSTLLVYHIFTFVSYSWLVLLPLAVLGGIGQAILFVFLRLRRTRDKKTT
ncbi:hypothetical protein [Enterococcus sp. BWR-S5]|uniref:hypothetical protein n=1 Tax=Enterococcus sp. BWR-S5 TaxID=2787714 RepID=UPI001921AF8E|nr:hypothetical protein [Enterococcus sp. BWR-S5]MBL1224135.1 hypothetical protein [Enterococcus sp. BWR-S5]